ncbi:4a-hydroxytetrahydrobiopterin dehydratase [Aliamphritea hakodatensis]|uniref:4a-hydroxytetrahydrobiopterin dehydratase n=1 Tax=Aliamphritea hakodatensis TaxID=2895352 RepID=UPI0022FD9DC8|nr:4a-hydroxytetrahydrobiopterin dehydratase [Aliamphritea hakodatensis]
MVTQITLEGHCEPCSATTEALTAQAANRLLDEVLPEWQLDLAGVSIYRDYRFKNYHQTMAFVNAVAFIAHREGHHPDLEVGYNHCLVRYSTHKIGGLSNNDFVCAKLVDGLL